MSFWRRKRNVEPDPRLVDRDAMIREHYARKDAAEAQRAVERAQSVGRWIARQAAKNGGVWLPPSHRSEFIGCED